MCKMMEDMKNEAAKEAASVAELAVKKKMARKLLIEGKRSLEAIAEFTELSLDEVEELAKQVNE